MKKIALILKRDTVRQLTVAELRPVAGAALENIASVPPLACDSKTTCPFTNGR